MDQSPQLSTLQLTFRHPASAFLYQATKPRIRVDGTEILTSGWGTEHLVVAPGRHKVEVWVPYALPRRAGKARIDVTLSAGERLALEYMAPTVTFGRGALGEPGGQASSGYSTIMTLNFAFVLAALAVLVVLASR